MVRLTGGVSHFGVQGGRCSGVRNRVFQDLFDQKKTEFFGVAQGRSGF